MKEATSLSVAKLAHLGATVADPGGVHVSPMLKGDILLDLSICTM